jgi:hypothetical protein
VREPPARCDVELRVRERPIGRTPDMGPDEPAPSAMLMVRGLRINGQELLIPRGGKVTLKLGAAPDIAVLVVSLFPSSVRLVGEADWDPPG